MIIVRIRIRVGGRILKRFVVETVRKIEVFVGAMTIQIKTSSSSEFEFVLVEDFDQERSKRHE